MSNATTTLSRSQRRELVACEKLAIEITRDAAGYTARVHQEDVTLHQTPYYPEAEGAFQSAEYEFQRIVAERVEQAEHEARKDELANMVPADRLKFLREEAEC